MSDSPTTDQEGTHILQPRGPKVSAAVVIVAAGKSTRMGLAKDERKPQLLLEGLPILERTCALFNSIEEVTEIILVAFEDDIPAFEQWTVDKPALAKVRGIIPGGKQRADSVRAGVFWCGFDVDVIAVHDGARPLTDPNVVLTALRTARAKGAALVAAPVHDTIKESDDGRTAVRTLDRSKLWAAQTPQAFDAKRLRELVKLAAEEGFTPTDDASLWQRYEGAITLVPSDASNLKITTRADLAIASAILRARGE
ncbi:MAG: 2-C-methyl-D-erythritol 4-phosphate cytidylyltransferase [Bacteroidia bacterium]|jgi:2-C-methyl-D-erythritol 4-phosphate cytidylyltransferase